MTQDMVYDFTREDDRQQACAEYSTLMQNCLSSYAEKRMDALDSAANEAGLRFNMTNESAYRQPNALVAPRFELVQMEQEQDFADAVAGMPGAETAQSR